MRRTIKASLFGMALWLPLPALLPALARAGGPGSGEALKATDVSIVLDGQSTLHSWKASALSATVTARLADRARDGLLKAVEQGDLKGLDLVVDVDSLKTTESSGMDRNLRHALESDKFPEIRFHLKRCALAGLTVTAQGDLSIHGVVKPVTLTGLLTVRGAALAVAGEHPLLMSDYGVKPPVMMFGTVKTADTVDIVYRFKLEQ